MTSSDREDRSLSQELVPPAPTWDEQVAAWAEGTGTTLDAGSRTLTADDLMALADDEVAASRLTEFSAVGAGLTDADLAVFARFPRLAALRLTATPVGDAGCGHLARCRELTRLDLPAGTMTAAGLAELATLPKLTSLRVGSDRLPPDGLTGLAGATALTHLHVIDVPLDRASVEAVVRLTTLRSCYLDGADLTDDDLARLLDGRPDLHVHLDQAHPHRRPSRP